MSALSPKPLSEVLRQHGGLCVNPIFWTSPLLDLLGCRFQQVDDETASSPTIDETANRPPISDEEYAQMSRCERSARLLTAFGLPRSKRGDMEYLLHYDEQGGFETCSRHTDFFFANRRVHRSDCNVFAPDNRAGPIPRLLVGYFHYSYIESARSRKLQARPHPGAGHNMAGASLSRKKLSKVTPDEWSRDPYLVCLLLSLAQRQARSLASPQQTTYMSRLLVTTTKKPDHRHFIYLYEAEIASQLLDMLDMPTLATDRTAWPTIKLKRIPFRPFKDFQARLIAELLAPSTLGTS